MQNLLNSCPVLVVCQMYQLILSSTNTTIPICVRLIYFDFLAMNIIEKCQDCIKRPKINSEKKLNKESKKNHGGTKNRTRASM